MRKIIFKHLTFIFLIISFIMLVWFLFILNFFSYRIKKDIYPLILDSKSILTEIVTKDFAKDRINKILLNLKQNQKIFDFGISNKNKDFYSLNSDKKKNLINFLFKFSYPIKQNGKVLGYIHVWPNPDLFASAITKKINLTIVLLSIIFALVLFIIISYIYITRYVFRPVLKINKMIGSMSKQRSYNFAFSDDKSLWSEIFVGLKNLNTKVVDIKTAMELLISASKVLTSDMDLLNAVHLIFNIFQQKVNNNAICILFMASDNARLRVFAKDFFLNSKMQFVSDKTGSVIWNCYEDQKEYICSDTDTLSENDKEMFEQENIKKLINVPLNVNNTDKLCMGVFCVGIKDEKYFNDETLYTLREIARCLSILIFHRENYLKIKERNRKLEMEIQNISKETLNKNTILIQKIRTVNAICDISDYSLKNFDLEDVVYYIIEKIKYLLMVETAGVFIYNTKTNDFYTVGGSFGINNAVKIVNKSKSILDEIVNTKQSVVVKSKTEFQKYNNSDVLKQYLNVKSVVAVPVKKENEIIAVLAAINKISLKFSEYDVKTLEEFAIVIFGIIEKIKLYNMLKEKEAKE